MLTLTQNNLVGLPVLEFHAVIPVCVSMPVVASTDIVRGWASTPIAKAVHMVMACYAHGTLPRWELVLVIPVNIWKQKD